jgi:hypothetical protein
VGEGSLAAVRRKEYEITFIALLLLIMEVRSGSGYRRGRGYIPHVMNISKRSLEAIRKLNRVGSDGCRRTTHGYKG